MDKHQELWEWLKGYLLEEIRNPNSYSDDIDNVMQMRFILRAMEERENE